MKKLILTMMAFAAIVLGACGQSIATGVDTAPSAEPMGGLRTEAVPGTGCASGGWIVSSAGGCAFGSQYGVSPATCGQGTKGECWSFDTSGFGQFSTHIINGSTNGQLGTDFTSMGDDYRLTASGAVPLLWQWWAGAIGADTQDRGNPQSCVVNPRDKNTIFLTIDSNDGCSTAENAAYPNQAMLYGVGFQSAIATADYAQPGWHTTYLDWPSTGHCNMTGLTPATVTQANTTQINGLEQPQGGQVLTFAQPGIGQPGYPAQGFTISTAGCSGAMLTSDVNGNVAWGPPNMAHQYIVVRDATDGVTSSQIEDISIDQCIQWQGIFAQPVLAPCTGGDTNERSYPTYSNP